ncbi:nucleoside triphosphate pyrophosphohydrolase [Marinicauda pacifica]|uniref:Nucleoside triphosphate pyrophosphohydrolase n=1 Tax=Marinicauda pacifica TaxID=1133559 RepID=A0A4S2HEK6_9PROT|nr:nucleoside triphosphate pyrophosphohydrolase [Marinicauda pacifica]TGY94497.1 nucleoside triphosphate pyrophosphohydrolase [Marinicauda pacifica]GGE36329.1 nucleoside triphosphate pyrophosphohydrolase [Marinicauda pacifica]
MTATAPSSVHAIALDETRPPLERLLALMGSLRDRDFGCPWDVEQDFASIAPYTIEEAYEVADAIDRGDIEDLRDELGDLLFQVVFHSQIAKEGGHFVFDDVARAITDKMIRRHPHVFAEDESRTAAAQTVAWEDQKARERAQKGRSQSLLDDVPVALPALKRAGKLTKRAARVGFDWPDAERVFEKFEEEARELRAAIAAGDQENIAEELGDLLFVCANLARKLGVEPESALRGTNAKFDRRFRFIEETMKAEGNRIEEASLDAMEALWIEAKAGEKAST